MTLFKFNVLPSSKTSFPRSMILNLLGLASIRLVWNQVIALVESRVKRSLTCAILLSTAQHVVVGIVVKLRTVNAREQVIHENVKKHRPRTDPCGTPLVTVSQELVCLYEF